MTIATYNVNGVNGRLPVLRRWPQEAHPDETIDTFRDYFRNAHARDASLRIDHLLLSPAIAGRLAASA